MPSSTIPVGFCQCGCGGRTPIAKKNDASKGYVRGQPVRFLPQHGARVPKPLVQRLEAHVNRTDDGCWIWTGSIRPNGYGQIAVDVDGRRLPRQVHRVAYELFVGPIPDGLDLDHLCRNRACFNPAHLEPVTRRENARRGIKGILTTHCPKGHPYDEANTYVRPNGHRGCRACRAQKGPS
jgi:hypothetical protein